MSDDGTDGATRRAPSRLTTALGRSYRVERELGQGGMATVYLAHDLKHDRDVAIKVLHPDLGAALGAERFLSEIKTTARLQHPHVLPLLDSGDADGLLYYVMPLVTGETLRQRLDRERQLPVDDAVLIAREVADALGYAHGLGVIHRDIKPENILLQGGHALVADFGIALAVQQAGGARMTQTGLSLGTPQYMSPEQAMGERSVDARSDLYALGAVTYEMLTGEAPFTGPSVQAIVARLVTEEPRGIVVQRKAVPEHVEAAVLRALEKLPADRFEGAAQFAAALAGDGPTRTTRAAAVVAARGTAWRRRFIAATAVAVAAAAVAAWSWFGPSRTGSGEVERQYISLGDSLAGQVPFTAESELAMSPDGAVIAFTGDTLGRLWLKRRDALEPVPLPGTEAASSPTFSPDGRWLAFVSGGVLKKLRPEGGVATTLSDSVAPYGLAWMADGTIIYASASLLGMRRVSQDGGLSTVVIADSVFGGNAALFPSPLPASRGVFFVLCNSGCTVSTLQVLDLGAGAVRRLVDDALAGWHLPTGHLFYLRRDGAGMMAPFDLGSLTITGPAVPVFEGVVPGVGRRPQFVLSTAGTLLYGQGAAGGDVRSLQRLSRSRVQSTFDPAWGGRFGEFSLAPDGRSAAMSVNTSGGTDVWIKQLNTGPFTRLTYSGRDRRPAFSPDGREVAFVRDTVRSSDVWSRTVNGSGRERRLAHLDRPIQEVVWTPDMRWILVRTDNSATSSADIIALQTNGDTTQVPVAASPTFIEAEPAVSPDGRWVAYTSNESGHFEVYVRPFPESAQAQWQVSNGFGGSPVWSADGTELFFLDANTRIVAARLGDGPDFSVTSLTPVSDAARLRYVGYHQAFQVTRDGDFVFLASQTTKAGQSRKLVRIDHWFDDVRSKLKQ